MKRGSWPWLLIGFGMFLPVLASGQPASLLLDIAPDDAEPRTGSFYDLQKAGDRLYFSSDGVTTGAELWVSDGTTTGTEVVRDLCPGSCTSFPTLFGALGKLMIWSAELPSGDPQLWRSDGTRPGIFALTSPEVEVLTGVPYEPEKPYAFLGRSFYFVGCSWEGEGRDCDLWQTDGSVAGTRLFREIPGAILWLFTAGDRMYFVTGDDGGSDLWGTDGTAAGTVKLHRFPGQFVRPASPVAAGGRLFFVAPEGGSAVWTSDGTAAGTRAVKQVPPAQPLEQGKWLLPAGGQVYFVGESASRGRELWRTDGTTQGTFQVTDFKPDQPFRLDSQPFLAVLGDTLVFTANDGLTYSGLWSTRGTPQTTIPLPCDDCRFDLYFRLTVAGGQVFFDVTRSDRTSLWATDGTAAGTRKLKELCQFCGGLQSVAVSWNGGALLNVASGFWFSDGTSAGTRPLRSLTDAGASLFEVEEMGGELYFLADGLWALDRQEKSRPVLVPPVPGASSRPERLTSFGGKLLFTAVGDLWTSAGTAATTARANPAQDFRWEDTSDFVRAGSLLFFQVERPSREHELWRTDGTTQGTVLLTHLPGEAVLVSYQGFLYFFAGGEIWKSDGSPAGTVRTGDLPGEATQVVAAAAGTNGIYMGLEIDYNDHYDAGIWLTDGTTAGTRQIVEGSGSGLSELTEVGSWTYFVLASQLWRTDGTPEGTAPVDGRSLSPTELLSYQGALYYFSRAGDGIWLWRADGTVTMPLIRFPHRDSYFITSKLTPFAGRIYFCADDGIHGVELWSTDGTPAGTALVRDLFAGPRSSNPRQLTVAGGRLFFTAGDDLHGIELWQSDGTPAGTLMVQDIAPQAESSSPEQLTVVGDRLFFTADDGVTGREVWVLPLSGPSSCQPSPTRLCLGGGRYAVEAAWRDFQGNRGAGHAAPLTADTGTFWFFDPANVEVVLKVLDGRGLNDHVWVFYGALSNVEYTLTVTDTQTGLSHRYLNPSGQLASVADTKAFGPLGATTEAAEASVSVPSPPVQVDRRVAKATDACAPSSTRLCLNQGRFAVEVVWKDFQGKTGVGKAVGMTGDTGYFWFFDESNVELVLKVLDGRPVNGHHWVFYGALSSVEYTITVTDTQTGEVNTYRNPSGRLASVADTGAF
ncbi:MAG: ELWxxDGT repeat protein [Acidobacteriota bacterium]